MITKLRAQPWGWILLFLFLNLLCVLIGMGVPFANIVLGLGVGWVGARKLPPDESRPMQRLLSISFLTAGVTLAMMLVIWLPEARLLDDPMADLANFGIPLILYSPRASFIAWLALMILIAPGLQALTTVFGGVLRLWVRERS